MQDRECIAFERTRDTDQRIQEPCPVLIPSSTNSRWIIFILRDICAFARWNFLLHAAKQNNKAAKFFVSLEENNSEGFNGAPKKFVSFKRAVVRFPAKSSHMYCVELALKGLASAGKGAALCMGEVMERPWVGVCVPLALIYW